MNQGENTTTPRLGQLTAGQRRLLERMLAEQLPAAAPRPAIRPHAANRSRAELSSAQRRIWFFSQLQPGSPLYTITGVARLRGALDIAALRRCLDEVVRRQEVLRTTFYSDGAGPWSQVGPPVRVPVALTDLSSLPETDRESAVRERLDAEALRPFDLSRDLMVRAALLRIAPDEHLLQLSMHHIAADGWSLGVLLRELGALYVAFRQGKPSPLPELTIQYSDYSVWLRHRMGEPAHEELLRGWTSRLQGVSALDLPTDRPRQETGSFAGGYVPFELSAELTARVKKLADQERATPFMVLFAAFAVLLGRWSGQQDVLLGCAVASRNRSEIESLIGFFVNTLPLRLDLSGRPSFRAVVGRARTVCLDGYAGQDVPFEQIVETLHPDREPGSRVPLVRHMLVLHNSPRPRLSLPDLQVEVLPLQTGTAKFELQLELAPTLDGRLSGWVEYLRDLFDEATVARLVEGLRLMLTDGLGRPDVPADELRILSGADRVNVVARWSGGGPAIAGADCLHRLFERTVDRAPESVAIVHGASTVSYGELERASNRLANHLIAQGVGVEDVVGICLRRSAGAIVAMLATLKAGAAYLPLDPAHPPRRVAELAADAGVRLVITAADGDMAAEDARPTVAVRPRNSAYVLYTSGSTGRPKGAISEHAAVANRILWMHQACGLEPGEAVLHKTPLGFDVSGWEWLWPLTVGARIIVADEDGRRDPSRIARLIRDNKVTTCHFVPSMLRVFLADEAARECAGLLRRVICSGEELPPELARLVRDVLPGTELYNLYGPTEAAIDVTAWLVPDPIRAEHNARLPIGFPISGARLYVLDNHMNPVPPGMPGELFIGGLPVCRGYRNRPGLTAERFVPDPFAPGARLYRTGDRARWSSNGALDFLGRFDFQVKVRGQRIEPGEIEAVLATHPAVDRTVVVPYRDGNGDFQLAAYASLRADGGGFEPAGEAEHVDRWRTVFDDTYRGAGSADASLNLAGLADSYPGEPIPDGEMREWADETVSRIDALRPCRVLEIGCGSGLLLLRLAARCEYYYGTDISPEAIARLKTQLNGIDSVELAQRPADDFTGLADRSFDTVILNSVAQYFPDVRYLMEVLRGALAVLKPGGHLFVGDVRNLQLLEEFHCSVQLRRLPPEASVAILRRLIAAQAAREEELVVHPALFETVAAPSHATLLAKSSPYRNELTCFRYDVIITVPGEDLEPADTEPGAWRRWPPDQSVPEGSHGWLGMPDARLRESLLAARLMRDEGMRTVGALRQAIAQAEPGPTTEPATFAVPEGYQMLPRLGAEPGLLDPEFRKDGRAAVGHPPLSRPVDGVFANDPRDALRQRMAVTALREHLRRTLPDYMVPASLMLLTQWPIGPNGKLDRKALPPPDSLRPVLTTSFIAPRTETERAVAQLWREILNLDRVGIHDDFFALGGHSLLAVQLVGRLQAQFGRELPLGTLLQSPTVAAVAAQIAAACQSDMPQVAPIGRAVRRRRGPAPAPQTQQGTRR